MSGTGSVSKRKKRKERGTRSMKKPTKLQEIDEPKLEDLVEPAFPVLEENLTGLILNASAQNQVDKPQSFEGGLERESSSKNSMEKVEVSKTPPKKPTENASLLETTLKMKSGNEFEIIATLGEGTYGRVYQVVNVKTGSIFAAKIMKEDRKSALDSYNKEKQIFDKIHRRPHSSLLQCLHYETLITPKNQWTKNVFLTFVMGPSLHDVQTRAKSVPNGPPNSIKRTAFSLGCISKIGLQVAEGMDHLERLGVYHLDLKPSNILFFHNGDFDVDDSDALLPQMTMKDHLIKIADYGVAKFHEEVPKLGGEFQTLNYRAPEIALGLPYDKVADVWSFGVILAEMYDGVRTFHTDSKQTRKEQEQHIYDSILEFVGRVPSAELLSRVRLRGWYRVDLDFSKSQSGLSKSKNTLRAMKRGADADELFDVLTKIFVLDPKERSFFKDLIDHPFFMRKNA